MVGNPAGVGVCGIGKQKGNKESKEREGGKKNCLAQASAASKRQFKIENTLAPVCSSVSKAGTVCFSVLPAWVKYEHR